MSSSPVTPGESLPAPPPNSRPPTGRTVRAQATEDEQTVRIIVLVEPIHGAATCQGNPSFPVTVDLDAPLGDRTVYDRSFQPLVERPWPPTPSSLDDGFRDK
jgi:hypothetical protein